MKRNFNFHLLSLIVFALAFSSCMKDSCERELTYTQFTAIYKTVDEIRNGTIVNEEPRELCEPGKFYFYDNHIFINENREGVHVVDNTDPNNPVNVAFIAIPGNEDIAIKNGLLYASNYIDLLTIDISDFRNATVVSRTNNVFPPIWHDITSDIVFVGYDEEIVTEVVDCETMGTFNQGPNGWWWNCINCNVSLESTFGGPFLANDSSAGAAGGGGGGGTGVGGSMARFSIIGDYLYTVDQSNLNVFSLLDPNQPDEVNNINLGWGIETIFPYEDKLFIGSNSGMFIYDNSNPAEPSYLSEFQHARACDPVFVKDNFAYVTLRDGTMCEGFINQLDLIDISDITDPQLVKTFPMDNPHGLSIKDNSLFLCEGAAGLKVFDIEDPETLDQRLLDQKEDAHAFDVINVPGQSDVLLMIGEDGFYQYDAENPSNLKLISRLTVKN